MLNITHEHTLRAALSDGINLFLGSGFSLLAKNKEAESLPLGATLKTKLIKKFSLTAVENLQLSQICAILEAANRTDFYNAIYDYYTVENYDAKYNSLDNINIKTIFTTNVDDLIYKIYANSKTHYIHDILLRGPSLNDKSAIDLIPLHGSVAHKGKPLVFSTLDLASTFSSDPDKWHYLVQKLQVTPTLFWGYSLEDAGVLQAISPGSSKGRSQDVKWIVLHEHNEGSAKYFEALGFNIITGDTAEILEYIQNYSKASTSQVTSTTPTTPLFP